MTSSALMGKYGDIKSKIVRIFGENGLGGYATEENVEKFERLLFLLAEENEKYNLTAITDPDEIILRHFADSLTCAVYLPEGASVVDVGCGAGFPSLPLCIARGDLRMTALDSTGKKLAFVRRAAEALGVHIDTCEARAEEAAGLRESFDCACARAVSALSPLCELCLPLVRVGGRFVAMKGAAAQEELAEAENAIKTLGAKTDGLYSFTLSSAGERGIIVMSKISPTPAKYPRSWAKIKKSPL